MLRKRIVEAIEVVDDDVDADDAVVELDCQLLIYCWFSHARSYP